MRERHPRIADHEIRGGTKEIAARPKDGRLFVRMMGEGEEERGKDWRGKGRGRGVTMGRDADICECR